jgi:hypothetical protein
MRSQLPILQCNCICQEIVNLSPIRLPLWPGDRILYVYKFLFVLNFFWYFLTILYLHTTDGHFSCFVVLFFPLRPQYVIHHSLCLIDQHGLTREVLASMTVEKYRTSFHQSNQFKMLLVSISILHIFLYYNLYLL